MNGTIGEIRGFGANFAPRTWAYCDGQLLTISQNTALFSILGTTYGGDGRTTFALPDLRGRIPLNVGGYTGTGPGLSTYRLGERSGMNNATLTNSTMPQHTHSGFFKVKSGDGTKRQAPNMILAGDATVSFYSNETPDATLNESSLTVSNSGYGSSFSIENPYLGINMIICMQGVFPSRS